MTTICASRTHGQMAGDTQVNFGNSSFPSRKIFRVKDALVGMAGLSIDCAAFLRWFGDGADPDARPDLDEDKEFMALVMTHDGIDFYEGDLSPQRVERDYHAIGTGDIAALAAMKCGKAPKRAVEIAAAFDPHTGGSVTVLDLGGI